MKLTYTTPEGWSITVFDTTCYLDFGIQICDPYGEEKHYSPHGLDRDSYGVHWTDPEDEDVELEEGIPWTEQEWLEYLASDAYELLEAKIGEPAHERPA